MRFHVSPTAVVAIPESQAEAFAIWIMKESLTIRLENAITDPQLSITCEPTAACSHVLPMTTQQRLLAAVSGTVSGIQRMSPSIPGLVQTSNNLARVEVAMAIWRFCVWREAPVDTERDALTDSLSALYAILDGKVEVSAVSWMTPVPTSNIVRIDDRDLPKYVSSGAPCSACHAGLECGIIGGKFPGMEI